ncbi:MAG: hypothetical protein ABI414_16360 [Devosia sp.]
MAQNQPPTLTHLPRSEDVKVLVSDLYLGAYLLGKGATLWELRFDPEGRASLVFKGPDVLFHRKAYSAGEVCVSIPKLKAAYNFLRDTLHDTQRRHGNPKGLTYAYTRSDDPRGQGNR